MINLPSIPSTAPPAVQRDPVLKNALKQSLRDKIKETNGDAYVLAKIGEAFINQHTINGARTAEKYTDEEIGGVQAKVFEILVQNYPNLSLHEIFYAFKRGMSGEYGEPYYFSALAVNHWLKSYIEKERKPSMRAYNKALQDQAKEITTKPSDEERKQMRAENIQYFIGWIRKIEGESHELIKAGTFSPESIPVPMHSAYWYSMLIDNGIMSEPTVLDRNAYFQRALEQTPTGNHQRDYAIMKAKAWFIRDQIHQWIINDERVEELFSQID